MVTCFRDKEDKHLTTRFTLGEKHKDRNGMFKEDSIGREIMRGQIKR